MLNEDFQKVLDEYLKAREENGFISAPIAHHIQQTLKNEIANLVEDPDYKITASAGVGRLSEIPWIGVFKPEHTNISSGYFFKADMSGVYLVLRVYYYGELDKKYGKYISDYLKTKTKHIKKLLEDSQLNINSFEETFDLNSSNKTADIHKNGIILCKLYKKDNIPPDDILINDLKQIMEIQNFIYDNYSDNMYLTVDEWIEALEDKNLVDSKMLNVLEILYNSDEYTSCFKDIARQRKEIGFADEKVYTTNITNTSKRLKEHFNKTALYNKDDEEEYWSRLFYGKFKKHEEGQRLFYVTLREELIEALENYDKSKRPDRIEVDFEKLDSQTTQYWLIAPGEGAKWWEECYQNDEVGISYRGTGDLKQYRTINEIKEKLQKLDEYSDSPTNDARACWQFVHDMKIGDVVFAKKGTGEIIGRGIVESDYRYDKNRSYHKLRKVKWTHKVNLKSKDTLPIQTLTNITDKPYLENIKKLFECDSFYECLEKEGYYFSRETIENYLLSLKVKPFIILTGNSGTGKTKLSHLFAKYLNEKNNYEIIPVGANWTENRHILGYHNIIDGENQYTPSYHLIKHAQDNPNVPHFLILDEMNLSHVERYFADFLSAIESKEPIPLHDEKLKIPKNLFIIGTVNVDETTYMFSPKVLDRANTIEFKTSSAKKYMEDELNLEKPKGNINFLENVLEGSEVQKQSLKELRKIFPKKLWIKLSDELEYFQNILRKSGFDFGFRVINEIVRFMAVAYEYEGYNDDWDWERYFDAQIKQKMLPKLHGSQKVIGETLDDLLKACDNYPSSKAKIEEMIYVVKKQRYVSFIN